MKVKIVSDGALHSPRLINLETGEVIEDVTRIFWEAEVGSLSKAHIEVLGCQIEVEAEGKIIKYIRGVNKMRVQMYKGTAYNPVEEVDRMLARKDEKIAELEEKLKAKTDKKDKKKEEPKKDKDTSKR